jgi:intracellular sulfur oxidation DsrE/DsrF family protein
MGADRESPPHSHGDDMIKRLLRGALFALTLAVACAPVVHAADPAAPVPGMVKKNRLVIQVSDGDPAKWNLALNNASNVQKDLGAANVEIEIVAYGPGIGMLKAESVTGNRVNDAVASGVRVVACENTMQGQKLSKSDMLASVGYVGAGVVELMQKQQEGWAYLRP